MHDVDLACWIVGCLPVKVFAVASAFDNGGLVIKSTDVDLRPDDLFHRTYNWVAYVVCFGTLRRASPGARLSVLPNSMILGFLLPSLLQCEAMLGRARWIFS